MTLAPPARRAGPTQKADEAFWRSVFSSPPALSVFNQPGTAERVKLKSYVHKRGGKHKLFVGQPWSRRYFITYYTGDQLDENGQAPGHFIIYFKDSDPSSEANGCIYLRDALVVMHNTAKTPISGCPTKYVFTIHPTVPRRPGEGDGEHNDFTLCVSAPSELETWRSFFERAGCTVDISAFAEK
eukprot:TRINITY_DN70366_c0_g1_i1.p1 TRINITY_DN70366_c0_g1~~TRINITY_DN70366_c0_g1_i1.p1  ORF type:complete len:184 (+),score=18.49 TRINITY_DN70366_c0_g1_i1:128-679(+)